MGISFSCPFADLDDVDTRFESLLVRSISFNGVESENSKMKSVGSRKMILEGSLSFKGRELETTISFRSSSTNIEKDNVIVRSFSHNKGRETNDGLLLSSEDCLSESTAVKPCLEAGNERHQAALKLQKTYKSFRTRRQLADCAVLVEQRWWKLLDFAELKRSSISFFDIEKPETAVSRWSRARTRAAKVGKGLSKDEKARKLALQHWLEAIDPRHRYGHNLQFYYVEWLQCESRQPFFYWLDIGEGKDVILERCTRSKLHQQCIKYLGPVERKGYEVGVEEGKLIYKESGKFLETRGGPEDAKWIFVLSASRTLYVGMKIKGQFQHSSFLAGGATLSAGRLVVEDGVLKAVWPHSGHYLPTEENFEAFMLFLKEHHVDLSTVQKSPRGEDEVSFSRNENSFGLRNSTSEPDFCRSSNETSDVKTGPAKHYCDDAENYRPPSSKWSRELRSKITSLKIPKRPNNFQISIEEEEEEECHSDGYETGDEPETEFTVAKRNLFDEEEEEEEEESIPKEKIVQRINSHKGMKSYQLAQQLSCKWTTGAGPRIGCLRDYPSELQCRALEEANLSPRGFASSPRKTTLRPSPRGLTPTGLCRETNSGRSPLAGEKQVILYQTNTP